MIKKLISLFTLVLGFSLLTTTVLAADTLAVRVEQPKTPTNQTSFKLNFVALDTKEANGPVTAKCFKKGPSEVSFTQFDADKVLNAGGNSGYCTVDNAILNTNGTFQFKVIATSDITAESAVVSVDFNSSTPGTPNSYSKEKTGSCQYTVKFRTDNDGGRTVKVVLYRSDVTNFIADSGSQVDSRSVGSDQAVEIVNTLPDCNKTYYYAVRAFDSFGNGSGLIGDSEITTITVSNTTSQAGTGAIALKTASSQVTGSENGSNTDGTAPAQDNTTVLPSPAPTVLGSSTDNKWSFAKWLLLITGIFALYFVLKAFKKSKSK